jgi:hypothetical protein
MNAAAKPFAPAAAAATPAAAAAAAPAAAAPAAAAPGAAAPAAAAPAAAAPAAAAPAAAAPAAVAAQPSIRDLRPVKERQVDEEFGMTKAWYDALIPTLGLVGDPVTGIQIVHGYHPDDLDNPQDSPWHFTLRVGAQDYHFYRTPYGWASY